MSTRVMKEEAGVPDATPTEEPPVVFTAEERRVLREVLKRLTVKPTFRAVEVPGEKPLDESYFFVPICTQSERIERGDPRVDWEEHDRRLAHPEEFVMTGECYLELE